MDSININKSFSIEILTPLHVGVTSDKFYQRGTDFFWKDNMIYLFDYKSLLEAVREKNVPFETISNHLSRGNFSELEHYLFGKLKIPLDNIAYRKINCGNPGREIRPMIRSGNGSPIIPGSSIKGAIRSVIFNYLHHQIQPFSFELKYDNQKRKEIRVDKSALKLENELIGTFDKSIMRYIRVGDTQFKNEDTDVNFVDLFNLYSEGKSWESGWKGGFTLPIEYLKGGGKSNVRIDIAKPLIDLISNKYRKRDKLPSNINHIITERPFEHLWGIINAHTKSFIQKELEFLNKFDQAKDASHLSENLTWLLKQCDSQNSCVLRMAFGSGFHSITGDWQFDDHTSTINSPKGRNRYKSRKTLGDDPKYMGFIRLKF